MPINPLNPSAIDAGRPPVRPVLSSGLTVVRPTHATVVSPFEGTLYGAPVVARPGASHGGMTTWTVDIKLDGVGSLSVPVVLKQGDAFTADQLAPGGTARRLINDQIADLRHVKRAASPGKEQPPGTSSVSTSAKDLGGPLQVGLQSQTNAVPEAPAFTLQARPRGLRTTAFYVRPGANGAAPLPVRDQSGSVPVGNGSVTVLGRLEAQSFKFNSVEGVFPVAASQTNAVNARIGLREAGSVATAGVGYEWKGDVRGEVRATHVQPLFGGVGWNEYRADLSAGAATGLNGGVGVTVVDKRGSAADSVELRGRVSFQAGQTPVSLLGTHTIRNGADNGISVRALVGNADRLQVEMRVERNQGTGVNSTASQVLVRKSF